MNRSTAISVVLKIDGVTEAKISAPEIRFRFLIAVSNPYLEGTAVVERSRAPAAVREIHGLNPGAGIELNFFCLLFIISYSFLTSEHRDSISMECLT